jgi:hypothetical protein
MTKSILYVSPIYKALVVHCQKKKNSCSAVIYDVVLFKVYVFAEV